MSQYTASYTACQLQYALTSAFSIGLLPVSTLHAAAQYLPRLSPCVDHSILHQYPALCQYTGSPPGPRPVPLHTAHFSCTLINTTTVPPMNSSSRCFHLVLPAGLTVVSLSSSPGAAGGGRRSCCRQARGAPGRGVCAHHAGHAQGRRLLRHAHPGVPAGLLPDHCHAAEAVVCCKRDTCCELRLVPELCRARLPT